MGEAGGLKAVAEREEETGGEAEAELREAIRLAPSDAKAHRALGRLLSSLGRDSEASAEFRTAIGLAPGNVSALVAAAEFVVVEARCQSRVTPQDMASFMEAPHWGDFTLWVRR